MSVHKRQERNGWVVRWREAGRQHSRHFHTQREAKAFDRGLHDGEQVRGFRDRVAKAADELQRSARRSKHWDDPSWLRANAQRLRDEWVDGQPDRAPAGNRSSGHSAAAEGMAAAVALRASVLFERRAAALEADAA